ncbi:MAG: cytochrome c family protein [Pirellulales bacterium]|nr:cytochrome c family protein [Pirellulales bacterium]
MAQLFHPSMNTFSRMTIFGAVFLLGGALWLASVWSRSNYVTEVGVVRDQPVPFSHVHHVAGLGIDCRYCHTSVETSASAGMPSTATCMNCHAHIWKQSPLLEPVRASYRTGESLEWTRVHDLPDFVYFNHSVHVAAGVGCVSCHGRVDKMPLMWREHSLHMDWCLECHRNPEPHRRPREEVFNLAWERPTKEPTTPGSHAAKPADHAEAVAGHAQTDDIHLAALEIAAAIPPGYDSDVARQVTILTSCSTCHR